MLSAVQFRASVIAVIGLLVGLTTGGAALVLASQPGDPVEPSQVERVAPVVKVCVGKKNTVVGASPKGKCPKGSKRVTIAQTGPAGPAGPAGSPGSPGPSGSPGLPGPPSPTATVTVTSGPGDDGTIDGGTP